MNAAFRYGLKLTETAILDKLKAGGHEMLVDGVEVEVWSPQDVFINTELLRERFVKTAVDTVYG